MNQSVYELMETAKTDPKYAALLQQLKIQEKRMDIAESTMTYDERETVWDFFDILEEINYRLLELAVGQL